MKFGLYLQDHIVPEWETFYIQYDELKRMIRILADVESKSMASSPTLGKIGFSSLTVPPPTNAAAQPVKAGGVKAPAPRDKGEGGNGSGSDGESPLGAGSLEVLGVCVGQAAGGIGNRDFSPEKKKSLSAADARACLQMRVWLTTAPSRTSGSSISWRRKSRRCTASPTRRSATLRPASQTVFTQGFSFNRHNSPLGLSRLN